MEGIVEEGSKSIQETLANLEDLGVRLQTEVRKQRMTLSSEDAKWDLAKTILESQQTELRSKIQSLRSDIATEDFITITAANAYRNELKKHIMHEAELEKLKSRCEDLTERLGEVRDVEKPRDPVTLGISNKTGIEFFVPPSVFDRVLAYVGVREIFISEMVCKAWREASRTWMGWLYPQPFLSSDPDGLNSMNRGGRRLLPPTKFAKFVMTIEMKNDEWIISVTGEVENQRNKNMNSVSEISQNEKQKKVTLTITSGSASLAKEYNVCEVIMRDHMKQNEMERDILRLRTKIESDEMIKKGYQLTTEGLLSEKEGLLKKLKAIDLQRRSDTTTVNLLRGTKQSLSEELDRLIEIPKKLKEEERKWQDEMDRKKKKGKGEEFAKLQTMVHTLQTEVHKLEAELAKEKKNRDETKNKYHFLKKQIAEKQSSADRIDTSVPIESASNNPFDDLSSKQKRVSWADQGASNPFK